MSIQDFLLLLQICLLVLLLIEPYIIKKLLKIKLRYYTIILIVIINIILIILLSYIIGNYFIYDYLAPRFCSFIDYKYICKGLSFYKEDFILLYYIPLIVLPLIKLLGYIGIKDINKLKSVVISLLYSYIILILLIIINTFYLLYEDYNSHIPESGIEVDLRG